MPYIVFLSAVSNEFHTADPERRIPFESYRDVLAKSLRRLGSEWYVVTQEDLPQGPGDLLAKLEKEVAGADLIVHLIGNVAGFAPTTTEVRRLHERRDTFLKHEPELAEALCDA